MCKVEVTEEQISSFTGRKRLALLQQELTVKKSSYNEFGGFYYRTVDDITEALKPLLYKYHFVCQPHSKIEMIGDRYYIKCELKLYDLVTGDVVEESTGYAREMLSKTKMDDAQITGSAITYAKKYAFCDMFNIADIDPDEMNNSDANQNQYQSKQRSYNNGYNEYNNGRTAGKPKTYNNNKNYKKPVEKPVQKPVEKPVEKPVKDEPIAIEDALNYEITVGNVTKKLCDIRFNWLTANCDRIDDPVARRNVKTVINYRLKEMQEDKDGDFPIK